MTSMYVKESMYRLPYNGLELHSQLGITVWLENMDDEN